MYNKYINNLAPRFTRASAFLSPHTSGDTRPWCLKVAFRLWLPWYVVKNIVCWTLCYIYGILCIFQQRLMSFSSNGMSSPYKSRVKGEFVNSLPTRCLHNLPIYVSIFTYNNICTYIYIYIYIYKYVSIFLCRLTCFSSHHNCKGYQNLKLSKWLYIPLIFALSLVIRRNTRLWVDAL